MMRPLWFPDRRQRVIQAAKIIAAWTLCIVIFGSIGIMLAWRG
jgi:hypothetical protein